MAAFTALALAAVFPAPTPQAAQPADPRTRMAVKVQARGARLFPGVAAVSVAALVLKLTSSTAVTEPKRLVSRSTSIMTELSARRGRC